MSIFTHNRNDASLPAAKREAKRLDSIMRAHVDSARRYYSDASDGVFVGRLLNYLMPQVYEFEFPERKFASGELIAHNTAIPAGYRDWSYQQIEAIGKATRVAPGATEIPAVDIQGGESTVKIHSFAASITVDNDEIRQAQEIGSFSFLDMKAYSARQAIDASLEEAILLGDTLAGQTGLAALAGVTAAAAGVWSSATAAAIVKDVNDLLTLQFTQTKGVEVADTVVFSPSNWKRVRTLQNSAASDRTVLEYLQAANPEVTTWTWSAGLETANAGAPCMLAYRRDAAKLAAIVPMGITPMDPQWKGLGFSQIFEMKYGGIYAPAPKSIAKLTGTGA